MILPALIGGGIGLAGTLLSNRSRNDAADAAAQAAQFRPFAINTGAGGTGFDLNNQTLTSQLASPLSTAQGLFNQGILGGAGATFGTTGTDRGFQRNIFEQGRGLQGVGLGDVRQNFLRQQQALSGGIGDVQNQLGLFSGQLGQAGQLAGAGAAFGLGQGANLLGQDFGQLRQQELDVLNQQALPNEARQTNSVLQNLFSTGRLGTTGGANVIGRLDESQRNAELGRQLAATQTAQGLRGQNLAAGQGLLGFGGQQAGLLGNLGATGLEGIISGTGAINQRAAQRLQGAQNLFGFGGQVAGQPLQETGQLQNLQAALNEQERAMLALGINAGGAQASAGANVGRAELTRGPSAAGGFLGELGGEIFSRSGLFT